MDGALDGRRSGRRGLDLVLERVGLGHRLTSAPGGFATGLFDLPREQVSERYEIIRFGGGGAPTAETWVFEKSIKRAKGRSSELLRRSDEQLEVSYIPVPTRLGAPVTLIRRRGALGMSYISER